MKYYIIIIIILVIFLLFICYKIIDKKLHPSKLFTKKECAFDITNKTYPEKSRKKNIGIISIENRKIDLLDLHNKNVKEYANMHNYQYIFLDSYENTLDLPVYWWKLQAIDDLLKYNNFDYVLWLDTDANICHKHIPLEYMIELSPKSSIFIGRDWPAKKDNAFCAGVFLIKNDKVGRAFIKECLCKYLSRDKCIENNKYVLKGEWAGECYEQGVMNELINSEKYNKHVFEIPPAFLVNGPEAFGAVILHMYGDKNVAYNKFSNYFSCKVENLPIKKVKNQIKACIILTMYIGNNKDRIKIYEENIEKWLKDTNFDIYIVESSGYDFGDLVRRLDSYSNRLKIFVFTQENKIINNGPSIYEKNSLEKIYNYYKSDFKNYDIIFKITGKYYLPDLENIIEYIPIDSEIILQYNELTHGQNSEIVGFKPDLLISVINKIDLLNTFEIVLKNLKCPSSYKIYKLPKLYVNKLILRRDGSVLKYL